MGDVFPARNITYDELTSWAGSIGIVEDNPATEYLNYINTTYPEADISDAMLEYSGAYLDFDVNADGSYNVWGYRTNYGTSAQYNPVNSNSGQLARAEFRQAVNSGTTTSQGQTVKNLSTQPVSGGFAQNAAYTLAAIGQAVSCASIGIGLGKWIDQELYNANPDYWDSIGLSSLNPETWGSLTAGSDSPFAGLLNGILGIDPSTGQSQMYIDQDAYAYIAWALSQAGLFETLKTGVVEQTNPNLPINNVWVRPIRCYTSSKFMYASTNNVGTWAPYGVKTYTTSIPVNAMFYTSYTTNTAGTLTGSTQLGFILASTSSFRYGFNDGGDPLNPVYPTNLNNSASSVRVNSQNIYYVVLWNNASFTRQYTSDAPFGNNYNSSSNPSSSANINNLYYYLANAITSAGGVDGISNQPSATQPDVSSWDTYEDVLPSLQQQYPSIFGNPLTFESMQPDGTVTQHKYVPITMPDALYNNDPHPTATTQSQGQTLVNPATSTDTLLQFLTDLVTATQTQTQPQEQVPPDNPVDTGTGSSPVPTPPTGSASALWSVYHPTQAQVDAFGGWLWSTNFVDQLIKVFENPMDAIISLHKVFVTPVDAGTTTIHAGHLDSNVPSAYVTQQYVSVDCGYINCYEQFGNVFDYVGTTLSLYLPFIGIVPLNVDDVMRSTIHIIYGCDLFTGAILAQVEIRRDGYNAVLYQYGGDGAVMYPVSGSRSSSFLTGLMATLGAAASVAVTGGASIPVMAAGVGGAIASAQKQVQRSGGFSGNSGAMGCKTPYLIIERPQTKIASLFPRLEGYPTNYSVILGDCSNHVVCSSVHVHGLTATQPELEMIEEFLRSGVEI